MASGIGPTLPPAIGTAAGFERLAEVLVERAPDGVAPMLRWCHTARRA